jgi:hypothetical protein
MSALSVIKAGRTRNGFRLLVEGRGTLRESPAVYEFAEHALSDECSTLVVDLSACDYLDSTFMGCLVILQKRHGHGTPPRLLIAAPPDVGHRVLAPNHLDGLFHMVDASPEVVGGEEALPSLELGVSDFGRHVLDCHRRLAEVDGPSQAAFAAVADGLARELAAGPN